MELVKCRMQASNEAAQRPIDTIRSDFTSLWALGFYYSICTITTISFTHRHIYKTNGAKGFSRGLCLTIARDVPGCAVYFLSYEALVRSVTSSGNQFDSLYKYRPYVTVIH